MADVLGRQARREKGEPGAFVDPSALPRLVARSKAAFETSLATSQKAAQ
jgi:hypothetical protein